MHFWRKHAKPLKLASLATITCGAGWLYYQVWTTRQILNNALDTSILSLTETRAVGGRDDFVVVNPTDSSMGVDKPWSDALSTFNFALAKRLTLLANTENTYIRTKAVNQLARMRNLDTWHFALLSQMIDARTAVALARTPDVDARLFPEPPFHYMNRTHTRLTQHMKELLIRLHALSDHPCMGYFISKAFLDMHELERFVDYEHIELKTFIQSSQDVLPICLESLLHHASVEQYAKDIAHLNGLPLLMEIYNQFRDDVNVTATISRIISYLSMHPDLLEDLHKSGWIGTLARWVKHDDLRISIPAAKALANLDCEEDSLYLQRLYLLHPIIRCAEEPRVDVVFVHGLMGGVFFTWRQRKREQEMRSKPPQTKLEQEDLVCAVVNRKKYYDPAMQEYLEDMEDHHERQCSCKEYDMVWEDIPTNTNEIACGPYCCPGHSFQCEENCFTYCWPRDWLAKDCKGLRIIGVNYETNLSMWSPICPIEKVKTLEERSDELIQQLAKVGVGKRPIVWVTHSMGGLMVKSVLTKAYRSDDKKVKDICNNSKGLVFYSTPHVGSSAASFNQASALVIWPSIEVQELQQNSPKLLEIHQKFLDLIKKIPIKIVTFVETQPTVVSAMKLKFLVVEPQSGNPGCGEYYEIPLDHLRICKPASRQSFLYQKVLHMIQTVIRESEGYT